jgi:hypothetical protein
MEDSLLVFLIVMESKKGFYNAESSDWTEKPSENGPNESEWHRMKINIQLCYWYLCISYTLRLVSLHLELFALPAQEFGNIII